MTRSDTVVLGVAIAGRGVVRPGEAVFSASDEALLRGAAAFETIRVYGGRPFLLDRHVERLEHSALQLGLPRPDGAAELAALLLDGRDAVLRLFRTSETLVAIVSELPPRLDELRARGIVLVSMDVGIGSELLAGVKATSYALNMAAKAEAERRGADDALFLGPGKVVLEATTANVWWRDGDVLSTPSAGAGVLPGVTRGLVAELARERGLRVREGRFTLGLLVRSDEAFLTSSIREIVPVAGIDGERLARGDVAATLQEALRVRSGR